MTDRDYINDEKQGHRRSTVWRGILGFIKVTLLASGLASLMIFIYDQYFEMPSSLKLKSEIKDMEANYKILDEKIISLLQVVSNIEERDDHVYRMVLGTAPMNAWVRQGTGATVRNIDIPNIEKTHSELIVQLNSKIDKLRRKIYIESYSQDELIELIGERKKLYSSIPAIQPVSNKQLSGLISGFGLRMHPFYQVTRMHTGIDFAANEGAGVFATADGEIVAIDTTLTGYGNMITIDHTHGYRTRYAHLLSFTVKAGDHVKRGDRIAFVGNTGMSTAPHLHYEVLLKGMQINPVHYFFLDLDPDEFEKITRLASVPNQTMGN